MNFPLEGARGNAVSFVALSPCGALKMLTVHRPTRGRDYEISPKETALGQRGVTLNCDRN